MSILEVTNLTMAFADKELYRDASFTLNKGEHMGVVGQNGAGKSTLIKLITGQLLPDAGMIKWQPHTKIGYLDQYVKAGGDQTIGAFLRSAFAHLDAIAAKQAQCYEEYATNPADRLLEQAGKYQDELERNDYYEIDTKINTVSTGLGITSLGFERKMSQCSGGQRSKIILAKLLLEQPDVLLLDEPTNYLDVEHIEWLIDYLNDFTGAAVIISHDYNFLQQVTNTIIDVAFGQITKYTGAFQAAMKQKKVKFEAQRKAYEKQQAQIAKDEAYIRKNKAGSKASLAKSREKRLAKLDRLTPPATELQAHFKFPYLQLLSANTLTVKNLVVGYQKPLLQPVSFALSAGEKVAFTGFNGVGKSTLIKSILGKLKTFGGTAHFVDAAVINYFKQELVWDDANRTPLQVIADQYPRLLPKTIRQRLAQVGINGQNAQKPLKLLSGGEQTKVKLCLLELKPSNFLILDEPTNHLDDQTKAALKEALQAFGGNVIIVSHERDFYADWVDHEFNVEDVAKH